MTNSERWEVPSSWIWAEASEFAKVVGGGTPKESKNPENYTRNGIPWITPADLSGYRETHIERGARDLSKKGFASCSARILPAGAVLLSSRAPVGYCVIASNSICTNQGFKSLVLASKDLVPEYFRYYLLGSKRYLESEASGTTFLELSGSRAERLLFPIAPPVEQKRIVSKIDELFSQIEEGERALERAQKLVERYRQSVLKAAVTGELTREWREKHKGKLESCEALLARILKARREAWEKSELSKMKAKGQGPSNDDLWKKKYKEPFAPDATTLPELPQGWMWSSLGQLFQVNVGATPSRKNAEYWKGDIPWVSSGEVAFCRLQHTAETITKEGFDNSSVKLVPKGSVLLAMIGEGKTRGQAAILDIDACHNQNAASIWVAATPIPPEFIYYFLLFRYENVRNIGQGGNQPALNGDLVKGITIPLPPIGEIVEICGLIEVQLSHIERLETDLARQIALASTQRNSILREAFAGRLVSQDSADEPASAVLERIACDRAKHLKHAAPSKGRRKKVTA